MGISGVGPRAAAEPNVLGNVHCIVSCNSIVKDLCGLSVGGSRNVRVEVEASRTVFLKLLIRRLLVENKSRVVCLTAIASSFVLPSEVRLSPLDHHNLDYPLGHR